MKQENLAFDCPECKEMVLLLQRNKEIGKDAWKCEKCGTVTPWADAPNKRRVKI